MRGRGGVLRGRGRQCQGPTRSGGIQNPSSSFDQKQKLLLMRLILYLGISLDILNRSIYRQVLEEKIDIEDYPNLFQDLENENLG